MATKSYVKVAISPGVKRKGARGNGRTKVALPKRPPMTAPPPGMPIPPGRGPGPLVAPRVPAPIKTAPKPINGPRQAAPPPVKKSKKIKH